MKVIGITRRMDDLGRVVIPKEVRQSLGINEGDFLEIVGTDRGLLMQKCGGRFVATMQREIFKRFAPFGAFLFVFFRGRTAQDGRGPIFSGSAVSTKYVRKCCAI